MLYKKAFNKTLKAVVNMIPVLLGVMLLISLVLTLVPMGSYAGLFTGNLVSDSLVGALFGSIAVGNPIISYILGGELLKQGISLIAITAFIVAWATVGVVQLPAESMFLGTKYALARNLLAFISSILVAISTTYTLVMFT
ncbi:MAG: hypothetical protein B6U72_02585 [Candidatus Altiarchaeales archaeon ex4484_2]|nr:MAG: hypothetical protein B6U72_02585 [Candidatus Altiarchaeales archaeon ex4484_2]